MMSVLQNAFANSSSSLVQQRSPATSCCCMVTPLSHWAWFAAYVGASISGLAVGAGVLLVTMWFVPLTVAGPVWIVVFAIAGAGIIRRPGHGGRSCGGKFDRSRRSRTSSSCR